MDSTAIDIHNLNTAGKPIRSSLCTDARSLLVRMTQSPNEHKIMAGKTAQLQKYKLQGYIFQSFYAIWSEKEFLIGVTITGT